MQVTAARKIQGEQYGAVIPTYRLTSSRIANQQGKPNKRVRDRKGAELCEMYCNIASEARTCNMEDQKTRVCEVDTQFGLYLDKTMCPRAGMLMNETDEREVVKKPMEDSKLIDGL